MIRNLSKKEKILLTACIVIAGIAIVYGVIIEPIVIHWKTINSEINTKTTLLLKNTRLLDMNRVLEAEYAKYRGFLDVSQNEEEESRKALAEIETISKASKVYIVNVKPRSPKKLGNYKELMLEVVAEGSIEELSRFLYEIETSKARLRISHFTIASKSGSTGSIKAMFLIGKIVPR